MSAKVAVIYYSATGNLYSLAQAAEEGAKAAGGEVRFRKVQELAPEEAIRSNEGWYNHYMKTQDVPEASLEDLEWADAIVFGTPTRYGNVTAQLKQFLDQSGPLWAEGKLVDKVVAGLTSAQNPNGGQESTLLSLYTSMYHWGAIVVAPGYSDPSVFEAGGNPYGASSNDSETGPSKQELAAARYVGQRVASVASALSNGRS